MNTLAICLLLSAAAAETKPQPAPPAAKPAVAQPAEPARVWVSKTKPRFLLAPKVGLFEPTSKLSGALFLGAEAGYVTPWLDDRFAVVLELDWVRPRASGSVSDSRLLSGGDYSLGNAEVGILLSAVYRFEDAVPGLTPYGGAGPGLYLHRTATTAFGSQYVETEGRIGLQLMAGADYTLGPGAIFAEFRYHFARVDFISTGNANVGGFLALGLGYRLRL
jgi:hypothetical protein